MRYEENVGIAAPPERVWAVLADLGSWPSWTPSMRRVEVLGDAPVGVGARVRAQQPRLPATVWRIDEWQPGVGFVWRAERSPIPTRADHWIAPDGADRSRVQLVFEQSGPLGAVAGLLAGRLIRRYVRLEAEGLRRRCESAG